MNITPSRISAATLVLLGGLLFLRHREVQRMEEEIGLLRERISQPPIPVIRPESDAGSFPINWQDLSRKQPHLGGDYAGMKTRIRLKQTLLNLSAGDLAASLEDLLAADVSPDIRESYAWLLVEPLAQLDPELALLRCIGTIRDSDGGTLYPLAPALETWAKRDPQAAIAWFDGEVAAGTFLDKALRDGYTNHSRFERRLIAGLMESDPAAARSRALQTPLEDRKAILEALGKETASLAAFASLVRDSFPSDEDKARILATPAYGMGRRKGYDDVTSYIREIGATPAERSQIVRNTLRNKRIATTEDFRAMRAWGKEHDPKRADFLAGERLSYSISPYPGSPGLVFNRACEIAADNACDTLLDGFLRSHAARRNAEQAKKLAELITDPRLRDSILKQLE